MANNTDSNTEQAALFAQFVLERATKQAESEAYAMATAYDAEDDKQSGVKAASERGTKNARSDKAKECRPVLDALRARPSRMARKEAAAAAALVILEQQRTDDLAQARRIHEDVHGGNTGTNADGAPLSS